MRWFCRVAAYRRTMPQDRWTRKSQARMSVTDTTSIANPVTESGARRVRWCVIVTVDITIQNLCRGRLEHFMERGFDVTVVCAPTTMAADIEARGLRLHTAPLVRANSPIRDLTALWNLYWFLRREQFDLIEISTPKASLVGAIAAWLARAPCVLHLLRGLAYQEQGRLHRYLLRIAQKIPCRLSHRVVSVSESALEQACRDRICDRDKIVVLGHGSSNGVDLERFSPRRKVAGPGTRRRFGIPDDAVVAGFVGRFTGDKGIAELVDAFTNLSETLPELHLLLVGDWEARDRPPERVVEAIARHPRIKHVGWQHDLPPFYAAMDFLTLPSYREGLATVLLEAAAMELPVVTTDAVGCRDVVVEGETGFCVPVRDSAKLQEAMARLAVQTELRNRMGPAGRHLVEQRYRCATVWSLQEQEFRRLLQLRR